MFSIRKFRGKSHFQKLPLFSLVQLQSLFVGPECVSSNNQCRLIVFPNDLVVHPDRLYLVFAAGTVNMFYLHIL